MGLITVDRVLTQATDHSPSRQSARNEAHAAEVRHRVAAIRHLNQRIKDVDRILAELIEQHPDANIFRSLPVSGTATTATFLAGFGEDRDRGTGHQEVAARWGAASVTQQSGKQRIVKLRRARDTTVHQAWLWFSFNTIRREDCWARAYYQEKRTSGAGHNTALRCTAQRWIKITYCLWKNQITYDEAYHQARRHERQQTRSPN